MLKKKKIRLRTKRALLIRGARLRKIRKLRALRAKRVLHKRPLKGRSAWLKKRNVRYGGTGVQSPYNQSPRLPLPIRTRTVRTARDTTRRTTRDSTRVSPRDSRTDISWRTKHSNRVDRIIPAWNDTCIQLARGTDPSGLFASPQKRTCPYRRMWRASANFAPCRTPVHDASDPEAYPLEGRPISWRVWK